MEDKEAVKRAEQSVLGAALINSETVPGIAAQLNAGSFEVPAHGLIWEAIADQHAAGKPIDAVTIASRLADEGNLKKIGGGPYLHDLLDAVPTAANAGYYASIVAEAAKRREVKVVAARLNQFAELTGERLDAILDRSRTALDNISPGGTDWPDPIPLDNHGDLPSFPTVVLPEWVERTVVGVAEATQTPADLAGAMALAAISTALQGTIKVKVRQGWTEPVVVFVCVALPAGNRKSSVFDAMVRHPLAAVENDLAEEIRPRIIEAATEADVLHRAAEAARIAAAKSGGEVDAMNNAKAAALAAEEITVPVEPRLFADDVTPEIVKTLMARHRGAMAVLSDEGGLFQTIAGRYSGVPDLDVFLKGHAGGSIRVERKTSGSEHIESAALTIGLSPQPPVLRDAAAVPMFEERGFLARFLWAMPASRVGSRNPDPEPVPEPVEREYARRIAALTHAAHMTGEPTVLKLTPAATARVAELEKEREPRLAPGGEWAPILSWASKWTGAVVRIAALLHLAEHGYVGRYEPIEADTIDAAAIIGHYYAEHALAVWAYMGATADAAPAGLLLDWLKVNAEPGMKLRDIYRGVRGRVCLGTAEKVRAALAVLEDHGYIRQLPAPAGKPGRPSPRYDFHPNVKRGPGGSA
ncbi:YfjI family protein [Glycomyces dulcitolivorans]|uniref:YfjI family protein n=1 Tax=Glycomyces dulcitolivorans TaxID=2200759 RepID=UPI000DD36FD5|nr:YfjI family protein [Glycomyces dulcitolivorans]